MPRLIQSLHPSLSLLLSQFLLPIPCVIQSLKRLRLLNLTVLHLPMPRLIQSLHPSLSLLLSQFLLPIPCVIQSLKLFSRFKLLLHNGNATEHSRPRGFVSLCFLGTSLNLLRRVVRLLGDRDGACSLLESVADLGSTSAFFLAVCKRLSSSLTCFLCCRSSFWRTFLDVVGKRVTHSRVVSGIGHILLDLVNACLDLSSVD